MTDIKFEKVMLLKCSKLLNFKLLIHLFEFNMFSNSVYNLTINSSIVVVIIYKFYN